MPGPYRSTKYCRICAGDLPAASCCAIVSRMAAAIGDCDWATDSPWQAGQSSPAAMLWAGSGRAAVDRHAAKPAPASSTASTA
jgi:hypothetical protein